MKPRHERRLKTEIKSEPYASSYMMLKQETQHHSDTRVKCETASLMPVLPSFLIDPESALSEAGEHSSHHAAADKAPLFASSFNTSPISSAICHSNFAMQNSYNMGQSASPPFTLGDTMYGALPFRSPEFGVNSFYHQNDSPMIQLDINKHSP
eukprot:CAMPEP_0202705136 /NCGR_PEP_ID=MMETSP1385-20130828/17728_1 /ASSEMBLY_ACC=CAM_ASM_000861 /TAXON_ID=933848 /ORGANISM="Elphidium margaritaceum" /LENGTH=152 /DNA_ID=CAMNT_0049363307 /DNA_START=8 /DNA_END=463 /DNA_ORIENTATION=-